MIFTKRGLRIGQSIQKQCLQNAIRAQFSGAIDLQKLNFQKYFTVKMEKVNDEFLFEFPNLEQPGAKPVQILTEPCELDHLLSGIQENLKFIGKVNALTLEKQEMSKQIQLDDLEGDNFYLVDSRNRLFLVENNDKEFSDSYSKITNYCEKIELSFLERKIISNYLRRFDDINEQNLGQKIFSDNGQEQKDVVYNKKDVIQNLISALPTSKNIQSENEQMLFSQYVELHQNIQYLKNQKNVLLEVAHKQEKRKMILGLAALVGQFCFVGFGTYSVWSWDIVEPMAFFTQFLGGVYCSVQFFKFQSDYDNTTYFEWRKQQALQRLAKQQNLDLTQLDELEKQFAELERKIKANVLINL